MTLSNFIARLNWRQLLVHFVAFCFIINAFQTLSYLYNIKFIEVIRQSDNYFQTIAGDEELKNDTTAYLLWTGFAGTTGMMVAFLISLTISIKRRWFWFNSLLVLILVYALLWFKLPGSDYLKVIFMAPGKIFKSTFLEFLANGIILLAIGLLIFLLRKPGEFIEKGNFRGYKSANK